MPTKILILTSEFPPQPGGIGNHAYNLAKGLNQQGFDVKLLCDIRSKDGEAELQFDNTLDFEVVRITRKRILFLSYLKRIQLAYKHAKGSDMVLASGKFSLWVGGLLSFFLQKKYVAVIHGSEVLLPNVFTRKLTDLCLQRFDSVIAVSNFTKSLVAKLSLKNITVIPNGFEMDSSTISEKQKTTVPALITVGNVTQRKGQHNVIKALPVLLKLYPDLKYHIVGIPTEKEQLQSLMLELGVEKAVLFHGKVSESEKVNLLKQADVFVMLSESTQTGDVEGFGIALLEANAMGIPAIGAKGCGIEDAISEGVSGKLIGNDDANQFLHALHLILEDYNAYVEGAISWSQNFRWERIILKYIEEIKTL